MAKNAGKLFEADVKMSVPTDCWLYRLRDNASSFAGGDKTRFTSSNICDYVLLDDKSKTLYLIECKSTSGTSLPFSMVRRAQIDGLLDADKHTLVAGLLVNFRNENNDTYFICIDDFVKLSQNLNKKSFNISDLNNIGAFKVVCNKKRTHWRYDIEGLIKETHL